MFIVMTEHTHEWYDVSDGSWRYDRGEVVRHDIKTVFHGIESTMIRCAMCGEVGYRLTDVDQNLSQPEELF